MSGNSKDPKDYTNSPFKNTAYLWRQLQNDKLRAKLYDGDLPYIKFRSRALKEPAKSEPHLTSNSYGQDAYLLLKPELIKRALSELSNDPYKDLGNGTSVLASDCPHQAFPSDRESDLKIQDHVRKRQLILQVLKDKTISVFLPMLRSLACHHAMVLPRKQEEFDFVKDYAEQAALIYTAGLFGIPRKHHYLLQETMRSAYDALAYQNCARHFESDATIIPKGNAAMAKLGVVIDELLTEQVNPRYLDEFTEIAHLDPARTIDVISKILDRIIAAESILEERAALLISLEKGKASKYLGDEFSDKLREEFENSTRNINDFREELSTDLPSSDDEEKSRTYLSSQKLRQILLRFDEALNFRATREWLKDNLSVTTLELGTSKTAQDIVDIVACMLRDKELPNDELIPIRLDLLAGINERVETSGTESEEGYSIQLDGNFFERPTVISLVASEPSQHTGAELVVDIVAAIVGTIGNITASAAITLNELLLNNEDNKPDGQPLVVVARNEIKREMEKSISGKSGDLLKSLGVKEVDDVFPLPSRLPQTRDPIARAVFLTSADLAAISIEPYVRESMRLNPPAAFLPRRVIQESWNLEGETIGKGAEIVLAMGALTRRSNKSGLKESGSFHADRDDKAYQLAFGYPITTEPSENSKGSSGYHTHYCPGDGDVSLPLIANIVANYLRLREIDFVDPGLAKPNSGVEERHSPRLKKKWGTVCESLIVRHKRDLDLVQQPLNVVMRIKSPTGEHANALRRVIRYGAPTIQYLLETSYIVHFARFVLINNDTELGLFTTYDGDFDPYLRHFAEVAGPLFDAIFTHIEDPPPSPVRENPSQFIEHIRRYDRSPVEEYFFSAYPHRSTKSILKG